MTHSTHLGQPLSRFAAAIGKTRETVRSYEAKYGLLPFEVDRSPKTPDRTSGRANYTGEAAVAWAAADLLVETARVTFASAADTVRDSGGVHAYLSARERGEDADLFIFAVFGIDPKPFPTTMKLSSFGSTVDFAKRLSKPGVISGYAVRIAEAYERAERIAAENGFRLDGFHLAKAE